MDMNAYLSEIEHAASSIITLVWSEHHAVERLQAELIGHELAAKAGFSMARANAYDDIDDEGAATGTYWETYFGPERERHYTSNSLANEEATLLTRTFSRCALATALLQYAKQGISIVHGEFSNAPIVRQLHGVELKELILQGRNQASHWEERKLRKAATACFDTLKSGDAAFADYLKRNLAFEVVLLLGWRDWGDFQKDMLSLS
jgi:hypothetical protein